MIRLLANNLIEDSTDGIFDPNFVTEILESLLVHTIKM